MKHSRISVSALIAVALVVGIFGIQGVHAKSVKEYVLKVKAKTLVQGALAGVEGMKVVIKHLELPPNFASGKHWHSGPVFLYILEGELTVYTEGKVQTLKAGQLFQEPIRENMQGKNLSTTGPAKILLFQVGDAGKPMNVKAK